jgi:hypothetical protein
MPGKTARDVSDLSGARLALLEQGSALKVFPLPPCRITLGRDPACTISLMDHRASKSHATLTRRGRHAVLEDLGSMNGTRVNESRIKAHGLYPGDVVRIGQCPLLFLTDGMPLKRAATGARGWIIGRRDGGVGVKLPVTRQPILFGSAPEAEVRGAPERTAPYHAIIVAMAEGVVLIELGASPPRCTRLTQNTTLRFDDATLSYRPGEGAAPAGAAPMVAERPVDATHPDLTSAQPTLRRHARRPPPAEPPAPPRRNSDASLIDALHREAERVDRTGSAPKLEPTQDLPAVAPPPHLRRPMLHPACMFLARSGPLSGSEFSFTWKPLLIGSAPECHIRLDDPAVEPHQARLRRQEGAILIEDLGRADVVFVNGKQVLRVPVKPGDVIRIGASEFLVHL